MPSTQRRRIGSVVAALALLAACSSPPVQGKCGRIFSTGTVGPDFGVVGETMTVPMTIAAFCDPDVAVRATVSVMDPDNQVVTLAEGEAAREVTERSGTEGMTTDVRVLPLRPGVYHFAARFEPNLGVVQADAMVAEDRRTAVPDFVVSGPLTGCSRIDVTPGGRLLCFKSDVVATYGLDGGLLQSFTEAAPALVRAARAGDVLWVHAGSSVSRWIETDTGFVRSPDAGAFTTSVHALMLPERDDVLLLRSLGPHHRIAVSNGALTVSNVPTVPGGITGGWRSGGQYLVMADGGSCEGSLSDGGTCTAFSSPLTNAFASEPAGLWAATTNPLDGAFQLTLLKPGSAVSLNAAPGWRLSLAGLEWDTGAALTSIEGRVVLVTKSGLSLRLQRYPTALPLRNVTGNWAAFSSPSQVHLYRR